MHRSTAQLVILVMIGFSYWMASSKLQNPSEFECNDLAALDPRCSTQTAPQADEVPPPATNVMGKSLEAVAEEYWSQYLCKKGDSRFFHKFESIREIKNVKFRGNWYKLTPADKLNGIEARGYLEVTAVAQRYYESEDSKWSEWINGMGMSVDISKKNGKWEIEDEPGIVHLDCNSVPD